MRRPDWILLSALTVLAALVRVPWIDYPARTVVDEFWYTRDGCLYWGGSHADCGVAGLVAPDRDVTTWLVRYGELTPEHPPLGKLLIGAPIALLGYSPGAWRLASAAAGVFTVALLYVLAKKALGSTLAATTASGLLAIDFVHLVHSRLAMLEIFIALFAVAAFTCCLLDREQIAERALGRPSHNRWRLAAGVAGGAATACKLSGAAVVVGVLILTIAWESSARDFRHSGRRLGRTALSIVLLLGAVPLLTYSLAYVGRLDGSFFAAPWASGSWVRALVERQGYVLEFHARKPSGSTPSWALPMTEEPLPYVLERTQEGVREVLLFGNPLLWWGGFAAVVYAGIRSLGRRGSGSGSIVVVVGFLSTYAGWLALVVARQPLHLFYAVPVAPFLALAMGYLVASMGGTRVGRIGATALGAVAAVAAVFYLPILTGRPLENQQWRLRACSAQILWFDSLDPCRPPAPSGVSVNSLRMSRSSWNFATAVPVLMVRR